MAHNESVYVFINRRGNQMKLTLPKNQVGKAFAYSQTRWDNLSAYLYDGNLQIDIRMLESIPTQTVLPLSMSMRRRCHLDEGRGRVTSSESTTQMGRTRVVWLFQSNGATFKSYTIIQKKLFQTLKVCLPH